jgi:hypothetical protein
MKSIGMKKDERDISHGGDTVVSRDVLVDDYFQTVGRRLGAAGVTAWVDAGEYVRLYGEVCGAHC